MQARRDQREGLAGGVCQASSNCPVVHGQVGRVTGHSLNSLGSLRYTRIRLRRFCGGTVMRNSLYSFMRLRYSVPTQWVTLDLGTCLIAAAPWNLATKAALAQRCFLRPVFFAAKPCQLGFKMQLAPFALLFSMSSKLDFAKDTS